MAETAKLFADPFADDIVDDPRRVDYSVPGLNETVAAKVVAGIDELSRPPRPRTGARSAKALLVLSPRAGFGKSHLIGTLFRNLSGRATLVNVRPFEDAETCWKSILMRVVQELDFPDRYTAREDEDVSTQLELFAHAVLSQVVADHLEANNGKQQTIELLRRPAEQLTWLKRNKTWLDAIDEHIGNSQWIGSVRQRLGRRGFNPRTSLETWFKVLYGYTYRGDWSVTQACLDWVQGDPIDDEAARAVGIRAADLPGVDQTPGAVNDLAKSRILDLCRLAGFFRPFLICFDQTETYGKSGDLARALGSVITDLTDEASNQLTLLTANVDPWEKRLRAHWEQASLDRLARPLMLDFIGREQGGALAGNRLDAFEVGEQAARRFWGDRRWLEDLFRDAPGMSVRMFLHACSKRWAEVAGQGGGPVESERTPLENLFQRYIDEVSARPRRLVYDRDTFYWLVSELAAGVEGVTVDKVTSGNNEHLPRWRCGDQQFIFGFESGNHWKRWHNIAKSVLPDGRRRDCILVYPRTPELPAVPRDTWQVAKPDIERARRSRLLILNLDKHELVRLYAAQELYADALQGDIEWNPEEVAAYLVGELAEFWKSILEWPESGSTSPGAPVEPPAGDGLRDAVVATVRRGKFLSLGDLMDKLPGEPDRETVLGICGETPRIKVHTHPNMTVLQWQSTA